MVYQQKLLKENVDILSPTLCNNFNTGIDNNTFPPTLKLAEIKPIYKKDDRCNKENYRPVSLMLAVSKILEKLYMLKLAHILIQYYLLFNVVSEKGIVHSIVY